MPGLTDDVAVIGIPEKPKKHIRSTEIELQAWRKLDENRSQLVTQPGDFAKKAQQGFPTSRSRPSCVMVFGILTANRKWSRTSSAQR
jgi:hypothetical protein